jgi:hypothetical protein
MLGIGVPVTNALYQPIQFSGSVSLISSVTPCRAVVVHDSLSADNPVRSVLNQLEATRRRVPSGSASGVAQVIPVAVFIIFDPEEATERYCSNSSLQVL